ncbi:MAG TPA: hypothetical protein VNH44_08200 [Micropepsaceae bacterium]|nr:hypothetical protein [Micropepsaceae bacterium]
MRVILAVLFLLGISAFPDCAIAKAKAGGSPPVVIAHCKGADDCEVKWGRALVWANTHVSYPIARATRNLIQSSGPAKYSTHPSISIAKTRNPDGSYSFVLQAFCSNLFGCSPDLPELRADFAAFVEGGFEGP